MLAAKPGLVRDVAFNHGRRRALDERRAVRRFTANPTRLRPGASLPRAVRDQT